jgi:hypothetical protein
MYERIVIALLTHFGSVLIAYVMKRTAKKTTEPVAEVEIDQRVTAVKAAATKVLDGQPMSKEQRDELIKSITDLVRTGSNRSL